MTTEHESTEVVLSRPWMLAVAWRGVIGHLQAYCSESAAQQGLISYLQQHHSYRDARIFEAATRWLSERETDFDIRIEQSAVANAPLSDGNAAINRWLTRGFVVLTRNDDNTPAIRFEAWAYDGPLDFHEAGPVSFGQGAEPTEALVALNSHFADRADELFRD